MSWRYRHEDAPPPGLGGWRGPRKAAIPTPTVHRPRVRIRQPADGLGTDIRGEPIPSSLRRTLYRLKRGLAPVSRDRIRACGYALKQGVESVQVVLSNEGRARYVGPQRCGSVWECVRCTAKIKAQRAKEIGYCVESHGIERGALLTLTIRHGDGDDLRVLAERLAFAWQAFCRGEPWKRCKDRLGIWHSVRAVEVTHGPNGWHPHLHILILRRDPLPKDELAEVEGSERWLPRGESGIDWIVERWLTVVERVFGEAHVPDETHGVHLAPLHRVDYLSKLGLEVSDPGVKKGRHENRTPLDIARDYTDHRIGKDGELWRVYCDAMRGRKQLTWSAGCKRAFLIRDRSDIDVAGDEDPTPDETRVGKVPRPVWEDLRGRLTSDGKLVLVYLLECAEQHGPGGFEVALLRASCGEV